MSDAIRAKWDARYRQRGLNSSPTAVLLNHAHLLPAHGRALDLACGLGANALYLAQHGLDVAAWDISAVAIGRLQSEAQRLGVVLSTEVRDVTRQPPTPDSLDIIVVSRFLQRELAPDICRALRPGGLLFYQTYTDLKPAQYGPKNPAHLLREGELTRLFSALQPLAYEEDIEAQLVARKGTALPPSPSE